jgi:RNA polymerase sigma-70 factor, ECF subfamily
MGRRDEGPSAAEAAAAGDSGVLNQAETFKSAEATSDFRAVIDDAHSGSAGALGKLFDECRVYLLLVANKKLERCLQAKVGASDLVQETFLQAQAIFDRFEGHSKQELLAWLKRILEFKLAQATRTFVVAQKRKAAKEIPIDVVKHGLVTDSRRDDEASPSGVLELSENRERLRRALRQLPVDYRLAIEFRNFEQRSFAELGAALNRTPAAARMVWVRAIAQLEVELQRLAEPSRPRDDKSDERRHADS